MLTMGLRRWLLPLALVLGTSSIASAAPSARDRADAAVLTNKARIAAKNKHFDEAADLMKKADQLEPTPQRKLDEAKYLVQLGKLVDASQLLNGLVNDSSMGIKDKWAKDAAKKQLAQFESRIPWLQVHVIGPTQGVHVEVDGKEFEPDNESPVDPGPHAIGVEADGYESGERKVTVAEGDHKQVTITLTPTTRTDVPKPKPSSGGSKWPAIAAFGVGAVGIGVGAAFGVLAFDETAKAKAFCDGNRCPATPDVIDARNVAIANGNVSTVGFVVGGVGVAAGIVLLLTVGSSSKADDGKDKKKEEDAVIVRPYVGVGEAGLVGRF
jgi:hypothetical protein